MANVIGFQKSNTGGIPATHLFLIIVVAVSLIGFMLISEQSWRDNFTALAATVAVILVLVGFALNRVNPAGWKQLFKKAEYEDHLQGQQSVIDALLSLDDNYQVLCGFTFELIHIEFLVIGPNTLAVVAKTTNREPLSVENGALMAGGKTLEKITGNLWRACHLISIVIRKGYNKEILPTPILVTSHNSTPEVAEFDGIAIVGPDKLVDILNNRHHENFPQEMAMGFTEYLYKRYFK